MSLLSPIFCVHLTKYRITDIEKNEIICGKCGCVVGEPEDVSVANTSITNLFQDKQLGSKPNLKLVGRSTQKYIHFESVELSMVSNICNSLKIPKSIEHDIFYWYKLIRKNLKITKAKIIILVFFKLCKYNQFPIIEEELITVVKSNMNVKNAPTYKNIIFNANSIMDGNNIPILEKIGFNKLVTENSHFELRSKIKKIHQDLNPEMITEFSNMVYSLIPNIEGTNDVKINKALKITKERFGIC